MNMNTDIAQTIISAASVATGFLLALFAEPIKNLIKRDSDIKNLRHALYVEILVMYNNLLLYEEILCESTESNRSQMQEIEKLMFTGRAAYDFCKKEPLLFYNMKESPLIDNLHMNIDILINTAKDKKSDEMLLLSREITKFIAQTISNSEFNKRQLIQIGKKLPYVSREVQQKQAKFNQRKFRSSPPDR